MLTFWRKLWKRLTSPNHRAARGKSLSTTGRFWLIVEALENRVVPTTNYSVNPLPFTATLLSTSDPSVFTVIPYGDQVANFIPLGTNHINFYNLDYTDTPDHSYLWVSG